MPSQQVYAGPYIPEPPVLPEPPQFRMVIGWNGILKLRVTPVRGASAYEVQCRLGISMPWINFRTIDGDRALAFDRPELLQKSAEVRVRSVGVAGMSAWAGPARVLPPGNLKVRGVGYSQ